MICICEGKRGPNPSLHSYKPQSSAVKAVISTLPCCEKCAGWAEREERSLPLLACLSPNRTCTCVSTKHPSSSPPPPPSFSSLSPPPYSPTWCMISHNDPFSSTRTGKAESFLFVSSLPPFSPLSCKPLFCKTCCLHAILIYYFSFASHFVLSMWTRGPTRARECVRRVRSRVQIPLPFPTTATTRPRILARRRGLRAERVNFLLREGGRGRER